MTPPLHPGKALIFRIVHRDNLPWILDHGLHSSNGALSDPNYRNIGNVDLIEKRNRRTVSVGPRGTLSDYVPFYFTPYSIMMYNIHTGYNVQQVSNEEVLILVSSLIRIGELQIPFVFTDQHAYTAMANYYTSLNDLEKVDWPLLNRRDFQHDPDDPAKKERYQAEALIWKHVPVTALLGICSSNASADEYVQCQLAHRNMTLTSNVQRNWYF